MENGCLEIFKLNITKTVGPDIYKVLKKKASSSDPDSLREIFDELQNISSILQKEALKRFTEVNKEESNRLAKVVKDDVLNSWRAYAQDFGSKSEIENKFIPDMQFEAQ